MNKDNPDFDPNSTMINSLADQMRNTPPPQKTAEQMLIDKIKLLEIDLRESSELNEHLRERMNHLKRELIDSRNLCDVALETTQELKTLQQRIKRLEHAGDEMFKWSERVGQEYWKQAKEAKP